MAFYSGVTSKEPIEPTEQNEAESGLDASLKITLDENETMRTKLMHKQGRALIEYVQLYLSQCSKLNDKKLDLADKFNDYLSKLEKEDGIEILK